MARFPSVNSLKMNKYCCSEKCFIEPKFDVDGIACRICECYGYCKCRCKSYKIEPPTLVMLNVYKTQRFFTCCMDMCSKFHSYDFNRPCSKCFPKAFCECILTFCKNRTDWKS